MSTSNGTTTDRFVTKEKAAEYLTLSPRRIEELARANRWKTRPEKLPDKRNPVTTIRYQDLVDYKAAQTAQTLDESTGNPISAAVLHVKRGKREARDLALFAPFAPLLTVLVKWFEAELKARTEAASTGLPARTEPTEERHANNKKDYPSFKYINLTEASEHIGLPRSYLFQLCERKELPSIFIGGKGGRYRVRVSDVEAIGAIPVGRSAHAYSETS